MREKRRIIDILFNDEELQGEEDCLTKEEIEGYSYCSGAKDKCTADCNSPTVLPTISSIQ